MLRPALYVGKIVHYVGVSGPVHGQHLPAIVVRIVDGQLNRVVLTIFTEDRAGSAYSSTRREPTVGYSAEMAPGTWHYVEDCNRDERQLTTTLHQTARSALLRAFSQSGR